MRRARGRRRSSADGDVRAGRGGGACGRDEEGRKAQASEDEPERASEERGRDRRGRR